MRLLQIFHGSNLANGVDRVTLTLTEGLVAAGVQVHALLPTVSRCAARRRSG